MSRPRASRERALLWCVATIGACALFAVLQARDAEVPASGGREQRARGAGHTSWFAEPAPATSLVGHISAEGAPLANARVCAAESGSVDFHSVSHCAATDVHGAYAIRLTAGKYFVTAVAAGFMLTSAADGQPIEVAARAEPTVLDLLLRRGGVRLAGTVLDATGGTVAGASLRVIRSGDARIELSDLETSDDGRFELWTEPGELTLHAEAEGYVPDFMFAMAPAESLELVLVPGASLHGEVVSGRDGEPVPGLRVHARPLDARQFEGRAVESDSEGTFSLSGLAPGAYALYAEGPNGRGSARQPIQLELGQRLSGLTLEVLPAVTLRGEVVDEKTGEPCKEGFFTLGPPQGSARADAPSPGDAPSVESLLGFVSDGRLLLEGVPPGKYAVYVQCTEGLVRAGPDTLEVGTSDLNGLRWTTTPGLGLDIRVIDAADRPVPGAHLGLALPRTEGQTTTQMLPLTTDARGQAMVPNRLTPGSYSIEMFDGYEAAPVQVELRDGMGRVPVTLRLPGRGAILVHVQTSDGAAIDDVEVVVERLQSGAGSEAQGQLVIAQSLGGGVYRAGPLPDGSYEARARDGQNPEVQAFGNAGQRIELHALVSVEATVVMDRSAQISGRVLDSAGKPAPNVWVSALAEGERSNRIVATFRPGPRILTHVDGSFSLDGLAPHARYSLRASASSGVELVQRDVAVGSHVSLRLRAPLRVSGTVVSARDSAGAGADPVLVHVTHVDSGRTRSARVRDGQFIIDGVTPGPVQVLAESQSGARAQQVLELDDAASASGLILTLAATEPAALGSRAQGHASTESGRGP